MGRFWIAICLMTLILMGCQRPISDDVSKITIEVPKKLESVGSLTALPAGRKACFGINVTGPGIPSQQANSCSPSTGVTAGFVESGQVIEASVPKGLARKIELLVYLQAVGQDLPCPKLNASFTPSQLLNTYRVASQDGVDLTASEVAVTMTMSFPGLSQHLAQELAMPAACIANASPANPPGFGVTAARGFASGTGVQLYGRVGATKNAPVLSGGGVKLYVRE